MIIQDNYSTSLTEVYIVLEKFNLIDRLPKRLIEFITENQNKQYDFEYDNQKRLLEQNISEEAKQIITVIYQEFLCTEEEKANLIKKLEENQKELEEKYSYENIFKTENKKEEIKEQTQLIEYKESTLKRIITKIKKILNMR